MIKNILFIILIYCLSLQVKAQTTDCGSHIVFLLDGSSSFNTTNKELVVGAISNFITNTQDNDVFVSVISLGKKVNTNQVYSNGINYVLFKNIVGDFTDLFTNYIDFYTDIDGVHTDHWAPGLDFVHQNLIGNSLMRDADMVILFADEGPYGSSTAAIANAQQLFNPAPNGDGVNLFYMILDNGNGILDSHVSNYIPTSVTEDTVPNFSNFPSYNLSTNFTTMQDILLNLEPILIEQGLICGDCDDCYSFQPFAGEKYVLDAWIKEEHLTQQTDYTHSQVKLLFLDEDELELPGSTLIFTPKGNIIDGWQRVHDAFTIPTGTVYLSIELVNTNEQQGSSYFDDVRIFPYHGNMKSFVYDQKTQKLMSELDENNYATFYEYDKEGGLIRVKKETEKGVMTIQETRSSSTKK